MILPLHLDLYQLCMCVCSIQESLNKFKGEFSPTTLCAILQSSFGYTSLAPSRGAQVIIYLFIYLLTYLLIFETGFLCVVALAVLELTL